ncbi:MAG: hypothetical protein K2I64_06780 [Muribaculaceae bacterium]|nr:hypothetical protein [Muribaculaceae bacterium]
MKKAAFFLAFITPFLLLGQIPLSKYLNEDNIHIASDWSREGCQGSDIKDIYTRAEVVDSVFMDMIVDVIYDVWHNDSIYNLITTEYYPYNERSEHWTYANISITHRDSISHSDFYKINQKLIPAGYNEQYIKDSQFLEVSICFYHLPYHTPYGKFYTNYKGRDYFFDNTIILNPTSGKKEILIKEDPDWASNLWNYVRVFFIYLDGKLYLDPFDNYWRDAF